MVPVFLHGLESTSRGTKGRWFSERFPEMLMRDFSGTLAERMVQLEGFLGGRSDLVLIGSSFGGLMASIYAIAHSTQVSRVVLLAPALNFHEFTEYETLSTPVPAVLYIGEDDTVCPPDRVVPVAEKVFTDITVHRVNDDHLLRETFATIDWSGLIP